MIISFKKNNGGGGGGYVLPTATPTRLGGVKIGEGVNVDSAGTISVDVPEINVATTASTGVVKIGEGINIDSAGTISVSGGSGDSTKLVSVSELPTGATEGDVFIQAKDYEFINCHISKDSGDAIPVGIQNWEEIGSPSYITVDSDFNTDTLVLRFDYYDYHLSIFGGNFDEGYESRTYHYVLAQDGNEQVLLEDDFYGSESDTVVFEFGDYQLEGIYNWDGNEQLKFNIDAQIVFEVFYNQDGETKFLNDGTFMAKESGERAALDYWVNTYGNLSKYMVFLYYGELPQNEILFKAHHNQWNNYTYWSWNGEKLCAWNDENMLDRNEGWDMLFNTNGFFDYYIYNFKEGVLSISSRESYDVWELYGDWYKYDEMTYEPIDWQNKVNNIKSFALPLAYTRINGVAFLGASDLEIGSVPFDGKKGQILMKTTNDYDNNTFGWRDLVIPRTEIYQSLPYGGNEGDLVLTNTEYYPYTASTFIARNSTSESDRNNFSNDDEMGWYDWGNNYIYFGNASAYTNTKETFLYKIALRTNENDNWDTSNLAYINVLRRNGQYCIFMDNFSYYDTGGTPVPYTFSMYLSSTGTTSGNTPYLPLWKYWDGSYGYKFHFEIDQDNNLTMWMRHSDVDRDNQEPDYVEGQNYGGVGFKCMNHTEVFYDYINLDQDDTYLSIYKGGVWYELGYLTRQGV